MIHIIGITFLCTLFFRVVNGNFGEAIDQGQLHYPAIDEASGLVSGINNPGYFWTHNDSGDQARIFLLDSTAAYQATYFLEGVQARDWEDIATMKDGDISYLLVGDIGDNLAKHATISVHRFEEPKFDYRQEIDTIPARSITTYHFRYEDGPKDAESLFFDPIEKKLYIISKRDLHVGVYEATLPAQAKDTLVLKKRVSIPYTFITSADISSDGREVLIKNLLNVYYWKRKQGESIPEMFRRAGAMQPYQAEPQGEAITFARDGSGYYTTSERPFGLPAHLYYYPRKKP